MLFPQKGFSEGSLGECEFRLQFHPKITSERASRSFILQLRENAGSQPKEVPLPSSKPPLPEKSGSVERSDTSQLRNSEGHPKMTQIFCSSSLASSLGRNQINQSSEYFPEREFQKTHFLICCFLVSIPSENSFHHGSSYVFVGTQRNGITKEVPLPSSKPHLPDKPGSVEGSCLSQPRNYDG